MRAAGVATAAAGNDEWITNKDQKDPEVLPSLPGYHVLIRPVTIREKTKFCWDSKNKEENQFRK